MMNKNTLIIIEKIIINQGFSISQLMQETTFTKRQIDYQIEIINCILSDVYHLKNDKLIQANMPVCGETLKPLEQIFANHIEHYNFNHEERRFYIYLAILCNKEYLSLYHLTDELDVSKTTIQADLKELKRELGGYGIYISSDRIYGYTLTGTSSSIQNFLIKKISVQGPVIRYFFKYHSVNFVDHYLMTIRQVAKTYGISFVESRFVEFVYLLIILSLSRQIYGTEQIALPPVLPDNIVRLDEYKFAKALLKELNLNLSEEKVEYVSAWLIGISISNLHDDTPDKPFLLELLHQIMLRFQAISGLPYADYNKALAQLYSHFRPAFYRNIYHLPVYNPLTKQILEEYATTATLVRETIKPLNYILSVPFNNDELAYLTIHFASLSSSKKYDTLFRKKGAIVCNAGTGFSALLKQQLGNLFPEFDFFSFSYNHLDAEFPYQNFNAIFSSSLHFKLEGVSVPIFYVPSLLSNQDKYLLSQKVYKAFDSFNEPLPSIHNLIAIISKHAQVSSENKLRNELINYFSQNTSQPASSYALALTDMINPNLIQTNITAGTAKEAVYLSTQPLLKHGYITQSYVNAVIETFEKSAHHTVIMKSVALPHAAPDKGVLKPGISITVLKEPMIFSLTEYDPIKYIFCLSAIDYNSHVSAMAELVTFLEKDEFYEILDRQCSLDIFNYLGSYSFN